MSAKSSTKKSEKEEKQEEIKVPPLKLENFAVLDEKGNVVEYKSIPEAREELISFLKKSPNMNAITDTFLFLYSQLMTKHSNNLQLTQDNNNNVKALNNMLSQVRSLHNNSEVMVDFLNKTK